MERINVEIPDLAPELQSEIDRVLAMSPEQRIEWTCEMLNAETPNPNREMSDFEACYDCEICKNKLHTYVPRNGEAVIRTCSCVSIRSSITRAKNSGLADELKRCKFSTFVANEPWQRDIKARARAFADNPDGWLYFHGQVGGGKTHLCVAVVGQLIARGFSARYMRWKDDAAALKSRINDPEYQDLLNPFLAADVLYIDDFLKTKRGEFESAADPGTGDLNLAFQLINARYMQKNITIISSEHTIDELIGFDEAVGSRIYERSKRNCVMIPRSRENNYRLKGG